MRGGQLGRARVRGGQLRGTRVRGEEPGGVRVRGRGAGGLEGSAVVPSNVWSSSSMFFGNIQLNDVGEVSLEEEEEDPGQASQEEEEDDPGQAAARASSQEDTQWLDWELDL